MYCRRHLSLTVTTSISSKFSIASSVYGGFSFHAQQQWDHENPKLRCLFKNTEIFFKSGTHRNKKENIKIIKMYALSREHHDNTLEIARTYGLMFLEAGVKTKMLAVLSLVLRAMWEESHPSLSPGSW